MNNVLKGPWDYKKQYMEIEGFPDVFPIIIYKNAVEKQLKYFANNVFCVVVKINNNDAMCCLMPSSREEVEQQIMYRAHKNNKDFMD
jgi:hypothetical protein